MPGPPSRTVVAVEDGTVVGTATMGPNRPGRGSHIATASFMVDPATRSRGVGRALGNDMLMWAAEQGYRGVQFNAVVETNRAAVHLWQSLGFQIIGTVPGAFHHADGSYVGLHVMFRPLGREPPRSRRSAHDEPSRNGPQCGVGPQGLQGSNTFGSRG